MGRKVKKFLLQIISFNSPQAIVFNLTLVFIVLFLLPTNKLYYLPHRSIYEYVFQFAPYSSGLTRAMSRLLHGDIQGALAFNKLIFILLGIMVSLLVINLYKSYKIYNKTGKVWKL